jgi:hypothetical protein
MQKVFLAIECNSLAPSRFWVETLSLQVSFLTPATEPDCLAFHSACHIRNARTAGGSRRFEDVSRSGVLESFNRTRMIATGLVAMRAGRKVRAGIA